MLRGIQAHNLKVTGSNPVPATKISRVFKRLSAALRGGVCVCSIRGSTVEARGREAPRATAKTAFAPRHPRVARTGTSGAGRSRPKAAPRRATRHSPRRPFWHRAANDCKQPKPPSAIQGCGASRVVSKCVSGGPETLDVMFRRAISAAPASHSRPCRSTRKARRSAGNLRTGSCPAPPRACSPVRRRAS